MTPDDPILEERLTAVLLQYVEATQEGRPPDRESFLAAHPELRSHLEEFFASHDEVERLTAPLRESGRDDAVKSTSLDAQAAPGSSELGTLGDFRLLREVGRGGMGVVYEAQQISLRRRVALKVLPFAAALDPRQLQRFKNEAMAAAHLRHEHIVPVYAVGAERGVHYYAMQFIEGQSLAALIEELRAQAAGRGEPVPVAVAVETTGPYIPGVAHETRVAEATAGPSALSLRERSIGGRKAFKWAADLGRQAALALEYAHQTGIVHRDIKPANLLLDPREQLWVTDFGLAQIAGDVGLTMTGEVLGTLRYASPEQALARRGLVDNRSDVYSLGATLYELLTLRPIFAGRDRRELLKEIAEDEPVPLRAVNGNIPVELETIVLKAVAKEPADRYPNAQELADDLERFLQDRPVHAKRPSFFEKAAKWGRRHRSFVFSMLAALLMAVAGLAVATVLTASAYDRERLKAQEASEQRHKAEENFHQARQAVDEFVEIGETVLAGQPNPLVQAVRQRLLESAVVYYQEFIEQRGDDPTLQAELVAVRERVQKLLANLAVLRGAGELRLLMEPDVLKDLQLSDEQKVEVRKLGDLNQKRLAQTFGKFRKLSQQERENDFLGFVRANESEVKEILSDQQRRRLRQISLQVQGPAAFTDPVVESTLSLTGDQRALARKIVEQSFFFGPPGSPGRPDDRPPDDRPRERHDDPAGKKNDGPLSPDQRFLVRKFGEVIAIFSPDGPPPRPDGSPFEGRVGGESRKIEGADQILATLTPEQKRQWQEIIGAPFKGVINGPGFPFGPPMVGPKPGR
jgi:serine/threonine protein kinase